MRFFRNNGLSIVLLTMFVVFLIAQSIVGHIEHNEEQNEHGRPSITYVEYLGSNHFLEATMENWESEFLQMFFYVILTVFLYQKGSAESKDPDKDEEVDREPSARRKDVPWPVRKGGVILKLYEHSLSIAFALLFLGSFWLHAVGGAGEYNQEQLEHGNAQLVSVFGYLATSRFWFESFQNWQSEFLAVLSMVALTIHLREKASAESKPVDSPHSQTGAE